MEQSQITPLAIWIVVGAVLVMLVMKAAGSLLDGYFWSEWGDGVRPFTQTLLPGVVHFGPLLDRPTKVHLITVLMLHTLHCQVCVYTYTYMGGGGGERALGLY